MGKSLKALVTGANGMLADSLCPLLTRSGYEVISTDLIQTAVSSVLDVRDTQGVDACFQAHSPDIVFHLAAETDVDKCELQKDHAFEVNAKGTRNIASACKKKKIPLVYISTGAVFNGQKIEGFTELDMPAPLSVYGKSKLEGEKIIQDMLGEYFIIRAGWMIGGYQKDKKFVWKIIQLLKTKKEIPVVTDKIGSPTFTGDFSKGILAIVNYGTHGVYHCVNEGICSRYEIARKIAEYLHKEDVVLIPVTSEAFPLPAPRGASEALVNYKLKNLGMDLMRTWQDALKEYLGDMTI
jgi:dTDP-4-dehydrorhamnose reductase